ncbi:hypothetical protein EJB05_11846, partial [Eragrostis curvula]
MAPSPQESTLPLSVELLEDIFLRLASPVDLASASATCKSFRQAIADPDFLRRYRAAHPSVFLGFVMEGFRPVAAPHPNAAAARADGFDFNYLPGGGEGWDYSDVCEGRVLLERSRGRREDGGVFFPDLAVCDPLSRRCLLLPTIPDALITWPQYDHGCFYWKVYLRDKMLKLDITRMEFSILDLPPHHIVRDVVIVEAGTDRLAMFSHYTNEEAVAYYTSLKHEGEAANEWRRENNITLPCHCRFVAASGGYIFLIGFEDVGGILNTVYFTLEVETFKIERLCSPELIYIQVQPYFGFPPFMTKFTSKWGLLCAMLLV